MATLFKTLATLAVLALIVIGLGFLPHRSPAVPSCANCNVLVIGVDTLRADAVHSFGYGRDTTPTIDGLVGKGYAFTQAISASSWTVPSFMSLFTGEFPSVHKVINKFVTFTPTAQKLSNLEELSPGTRTLAQALKAAGYATGGFTGDAGVSAKFGYSEGFDAYTDETTFGGFKNSEQHALAWLDGIGDAKFFMFFHGYDLHGQFALATSAREFVPAEYAGAYTGSPGEEAKLREAQLAGPLSADASDAAFWRGLYDSKVRAADGELAGFLAELKKRGRLDNTLIVLVSDHGEEYFEHGGIDHGHALYDELVRVPLVFVLPGSMGGKRIDAQVPTMDTASTILALLGVKDDAFLKQTGGETLLPYFTDPNTPGIDTYPETDYRDFTHKRSVRSSDGWKYILTLETKKEELYNLKNDPGEQHNLILTDASKADELRTKLRAHIKDALHGDPDATPATGCLPVYQGECL